MGECQVLPHLFWDMTLGELDFIWYGYRHKEEQEWIRTRWMTAALINVQLPKGSQISPEELIELDCDVRDKEPIKVMTKDELADVLKKYENAKPIKRND